MIRHLFLALVVLGAIAGAAAVSSVSATACQYQDSHPS